MNHLSISSQCLLLFASVNALGVEEEKGAYADE